MKAAMKGKAMKAKKVKKVSAIAKGKRAKLAVFSGKKAKTVGGLTKATLTKNKSGKIVSKSRSADGKKRFASSASRSGVTRHGRHASSLASRASVRWVARLRKGRPCMPRSSPSLASSERAVRAL